MTSCIFCKIVKGKIPSYKIYENENFLAFLDIHPLNKGHTLIIPKKHYRWVWDIKEEYSQTVNKVANALKKSFNIEYVQLIAIGNEVHHAHIHLIPRFDNDGHGTLPDPKNIKDIKKEEMEEIAKQIKKELK